MNYCVICGDNLPPQDGTEENDFRYLCDDCKIGDDDNECCADRPDCKGIVWNGVGD